MSYVDLAGQEWVHAVSYLRRSLEEVEPSKILCWISEWVDQEQRSYVRRARVRLWMAGWEKGDEWGQRRRVCSSLPTILMGR